MIAREELVDGAEVVLLIRSTVKLVLSTLYEWMGNIKTTYLATARTVRPMQFLPGRFIPDDFVELEVASCVLRCVDLK